MLWIAVGSFVAALCFGSLLGSEFFPPSDEGRVFVMMETPPGTSLAGTLDRVKEGEKWLLAQPELKGLFSGVGVSGPDGPGNVTGAVFVAILKPRSERARSAQELMIAARAELGKIPGIDVRVFDPIAMIGGGGRGELEFEVRGNLPIDELDRLSDDILRRLREQPGFVDLTKSLRVGLPELRVIPDREKCAALGIDARSLAQVVQAGIGGLDVAKFKEAGHRYDIRVRLDDAFRSDPDSIGGLFVRTGDGGAVSCATWRGSRPAPHRRRSAATSASAA